MDDMTFPTPSKCKLIIEQKYRKEVDELLDDCAKSIRAYVSKGENYGINYIPVRPVNRAVFEDQNTMLKYALVLALQLNGWTVTRWDNTAGVLKLSPKT